MSNISAYDDIYNDSPPRRERKRIASSQTQPSEAVSRSNSNRQSSKKQFRITACIPLALSIVAIVLTSIAIFSGSKVGLFEKYRLYSVRLKLL